MKTQYIAKAQQFLSELFDRHPDVFKLRSDRSDDKRQPILEFVIRQVSRREILQMTLALQKLSTIDEGVYHGNYSESMEANFQINGVKCRVALSRDYDSNDVCISLMQWNPVAGEDKEMLLTFSKAAFLSERAVLGDSSPKISHEDRRVYVSVESRFGRAAAKKLTAKYGEPVRNRDGFAWTASGYIVEMHDNDIFAYFSIQAV